MKNWLVLLLSLMAALVLFFFLTIFYQQTVPNHIKLDQPIQFVMKSSEVVPMEFWGIAERGIQEAAKEYGVTVELSGPRFEKEIDQQIIILEEVIEQRPPLIVLVAADYVRLVDSVKKAESYGIPVVTFDSGIDSSIPVSFIATDNIAAGEKAGREMLRLLEGRERQKIAIVSHIREAATAIDREKGVRQAIDATQIIGTWYCDVEEDKAYEITLGLLDDPTLGGIVALNEVASLGAARAVADRQLQDTIQVVAFDNAVRELTFLEAGVIDATVVQRPYNMGYMAVKIAVDYLSGKPVPEFHDTGSVLITRENMFQREYQELLYPFRNSP
ncbi:MAG: substrate-binding domain-containing protein [Spirochaetia bacterium]|nr:substrate-binding domain-containing protein [Spirochaetia bacterium]MCF7940015.1 substrate-binding domain-containing protein [Spirochaetia bacterium]